MWGLSDETDGVLFCGVFVLFFLLNRYVTRVNNCATAF